MQKPQRGRAAALSLLPTKASPVDQRIDRLDKGLRAVRVANAGRQSQKCIAIALRAEDVKRSFCGESHDRLHDRRRVCPNCLVRLWRCEPSSSLSVRMWA